MIKTISIRIISILLFILILFMSFWLNISEERLKSWLQYQINKSLPRHSQVDIKTVQTRYWGLEISGLRLLESRNLQEWIAIDHIHIRFDLISLLFRQELPFQIKLLEFYAEGSFGYFPAPWITLSTQRLEPNRIPFVRQTQLVLTNPVLKADARFHLDGSEGKIQFSLQNLKISGNKTVTQLPLELPDIYLRQTNAKISFKGNQFRIDIQTEGDIDADLRGSILANLDRIQNTQTDILIKAHIKKDYQAKLGVINSIISSYGEKAGTVSIQITGNLRHPRIKKI